MRELHPAGDKCGRAQRNLDIVESRRKRPHLSTRHHNDDNDGIRTCDFVEMYSIAEPACTKTCTAHIQTSPKTLEDGLPEHVNMSFLQTVTNCEMSYEVQKSLEQLLWDHKDAFAKSKTDIGFCDLVEHDIDTGNTRPIKQSSRRPPLNSGSSKNEIEAFHQLPTNRKWPSYGGSNDDEIFKNSKYKCNKKA